MPRVPRCQLNDGVFHATARAVFGAQLFDDDLDRLYFLHLLRSTGALFDWRLHAHCLMGTHYHVILSATRDRLSDGMRRLNGAYARRFNKRHGRRGHLFDERFASFSIQDDRHLEAAVGYVLQNPVRAGLCAKASDWPWAGS